MTDTPPAKPNRLIAGRYRLRRVVGQGSMGTVWEAYDEYLHRLVAVKEVRLPEGMPAHEADELRERTLREARAIAVLSHPNVITLHDVAREQGEPFVVMEYMAARSLAELLRAGGALTTTQSALVGDAVAAGLEAAHKAGITHRDVKPGNVLVAEDGRVKLTDFGIARNVSERTMTRTGIMLGSPAYISPEVASGGEVTPAADLWGLGATLFASTEGRAPYDPNGPVLETVSTVVHGEVPKPASAGPLADVITGLMVKDPTQRLSLAQVRRQLRPLLPEPGDQVFDASLFELVEKAPDGAEAPTTVTPAVKPAAAESASQLADDPGPLPFVAPPARKRRSAAPSVLLALVVAVVALALFVGGALGGFALTRAVAQRPLTPPPTSSSTQPTSTVAPAPREFAQQRADAATIKGMNGGAFSISVPEDWVKFVEQRGAGKLPASTRVHFLSPDGTQEATVERFVGFYPSASMDTYVSLLGSERSVLPATEVDQVLEIAVRGASGGREPTKELRYRTVDRIGPGTDGANRSTTSRLIAHGDDLWVVSLTVPIQQEDNGRTDLFPKIVPTFKIDP
ncbi:serine/threonine-protein kinase [Labedaea rhizosphaerae]|uniref:serine/threonine-protein kinase n=1 Tax=Labedaea rhizosphaerae TaxID=598644 RepID=UPI0024436080|nr:serine/threonine-protein kinase [Labedaea rhizosphaerae]